MLVMFPLNRENGQILRTKGWLYEALGELMLELPFADITVGHICKRACVSRTVFYNHYNNKEDLLAEIFHRITAVYRIKVQRAAEENGPLRCRTCYTILCRELWRSRVFFQGLRKNHYDWMLSEFLEQIHDDFFQLVGRKSPPEELEYRQYFIPYHANAMAELLFRWLCEEKPAPPEQMADVAVRLLNSSNVDCFLEMTAHGAKTGARQR